MKLKSISPAIVALAAFSALTTGLFSFICSAATYGNTTPFNSVTQHAPHVVLGVQVIIPEPLTLDSFGLMFGNPDYRRLPIRPSRAIFGLYDSGGSDGHPGALLATTDIVTANALTTYTFDFNSHPTVPVGKYWMMALYESWATPRTQFPTDAGQVSFRHPFAEGMPATAPTSTFRIFNNFNYWINGTPVPEPTAPTLFALALISCPVACRRVIRRGRVAVPLRGLMHIKTVYGLVGLVALLSFSARVHGDATVFSNMLDTQLDAHAYDEVGLISPNYNNFNNVAVGQPFIASFTGTVTTVDALIGTGLHGAAVSPLLDISIFTSNAGIPVTRLGTVTAMRPFSTILSGQNHRETIDFTPLQIPLVAGNQYMVVFSTPFGVAGTDGNDTPFLIGWTNTFGGLKFSRARDGVHWQTTTYAELGISVRAVPEPLAGVLVLTVVGLISGLRRRNNSPSCTSSQAQGA